MSRLPRGALILRQHLVELRSALDEARSALGLPGFISTDLVIPANSTPIKPALVTQLRAGTQ